MRKSTTWPSLNVCLVFVLLLFVGCAAVEERPPAKHRYVLDVTRQAEASSPAPRGVLGVRQIRVSPPYDGNAFVYRISDIRYETDYNNEFFISLGPMLTREVRLWLEASGLFQHVVDRTSPLQPTHLLEGTLSAVYGDYRQRETPTAVLDMQFLLQDVSKQSRVVFQEQYQKAIAVTKKYLEGLVNGWNEGLQQILKELETDLRSAMGQ